MRRENPFAPRNHGQLERLGERVWLFRNIVNSTVFVGDRGIAVVDTQVNQALARRLLAAIGTISAKPIAFAINTHYHWDHTAGNAVFQRAGATLVAGRTTAGYMTSRAPRQKGFLASRGFELGPDPVVPTVFAEDSPTLDLGGITLDLRRGHPAETDDPTLVWCPEERVLAAGDTVMTGSFPIFGQPSQREGLENANWLEALDQVRGFQAAHVTPGHGPVAHAEELAQLERICRYFLETVRHHHAAGRTLSETIAVMEDGMPAWITRIPEVWGTPRYAILRVWAGLADLGQPGWQHVKPSAIPRRATKPSQGQTMVDHGPTDHWADAIHAALEGGDPAQATALAEAVTVVRADDPAAWTLLASTAIAISRGIASVLEKGDCFQLAKQAVERALAIDPHHGPALLQLGQFQVMMAFRNGDDPDRGEQLLDQAAADGRLTARQHAELAFYRGIAERARGNEPAAAQRFAEATALDGTFMPARMAAMPG